MAKIGQITPKSLTREVQRSYLDYAMSVIVSRALPDVRDGLKPVHRRILYAMKELGLTHTAAYRKSARIVGEVLGKYHPHGDQAVYNALVRMAQDFSLRYPLVDGQGNFGSIDGDSPAAMRYTEARLAKISSELLKDIDKDTVDFRNNFDGSYQEPTVLPANLPNLLIGGSDGIAVGMATRIPPHNLLEVVDALNCLISSAKVETNEPTNDDENHDNFHLKKIELADDKDQQTFQSALNAKIYSDLQTAQLLKYIQGPDFPTYGTVYGGTGLTQAYETGKGKIIIRGQAEIKETKNGNYQIRITEIPYQVNKAKLIVQIANLVKHDRLRGIRNIRDESDRRGMQIIILLKKDARPKAVLNNLYKHTNLQISYSINMVGLVDSTPQTLSLKTILLEFARHRYQVTVRRSLYELNAALERAHILEGLKIALDNLDAVIETIKKSRDTETAKQNLMTKFKLSERQAVAILDMQLRRLSGLERQKIEDEYQTLQKTISHLKNLLSNPEKFLPLISQELLELKKSYPEPRRTRIYKQDLDKITEEDLIPNQPVLITITKTGYIKRVPLNTYQSQRRGGKGVVGMTTKEEDEMSHIFSASTHDYIYFFTNLGRVFKERVWAIKEGSRRSKGQAVINLINLKSKELVQSYLIMNPNQDRKNFICFVTKKGIVKKTQIAKFQNIRTNGIIAIKLDEDDSLKWVKLTGGKDHIFIVSHHGQCIRFKETDIRPTGRSSRGVIGMRLKKNDYIVGLEIINPARQAPDDKRKKFFNHIIVVTEKGLGKRTPLSAFKVQNRSGVGIKIANVTQKTGNIVCGRLATENTNQVVLTSINTQVIKLPLKNIPVLGRATQGVILMRFVKPSDHVAAVTLLEKTVTQPKKENKHSFSPTPI